ncbi:phage tail protein [Lactococcus sp.]|uniref:phage tail protein n=1 Tax=Lactococcus sp. TaxID=44273 RepID=UPI0035B3B057
MVANYSDDTFEEYLDQGAVSFDFTVNKFKNGKLQDYVQFLNNKTCFSFVKDDRQYAVFPAGSSGFYEDDYIIRYECLSIDREMALEYVDAFPNTVSHSLGWYIDQMGIISNSQIVIGTNEVSSTLKVINYEAQDTKMNRLISLINNFDGEFEFVTQLDDYGSVEKITLNIVKAQDTVNSGIGQIREDVILRFGKNILGVQRQDNVEFFNASRVKGKDGLSWTNSEFSYKNADGVEEFFKRKGSDTAYAPLSAEQYPAHLKSDASDKYIKKNFETEYTTVNQMWGYIVSQFKANAYPQSTWTVKVSSGLVDSAIGEGKPLQIGDTVTIEDENFISENGDYGLILSARVSKIKSSESNPSQNEITFSNFKQLKSEVSSDLTARMNALIDAATPYRAELTTDNGIQFKNNATPTSTTLGAHIYKGSSATETIADSYEWFKDGVSIATTQTLTVNAADVIDTSVYSYQATLNSVVVASSQVTITNVNDGAKGAKGDTGPTGAKGDQGVQGATGATGPAGTSVTITSQSVTYQNATSGTTAPTGTWSSTVPSTPQGQYLWTKTVVNYSDTTSTTSYSVSYMGADGKLGPQGPATGLTQSATEPTTKYAGMLWQYTGTSNITIGTTVILPQAQYVYDGSNWKIYALSVANLNADTLSAITANLGTVTAGIIKAYIDYTFYNGSATAIPAKAYLKIDATNATQKIALQSPTSVDWGYIKMGPNGMTIFTDTLNNSGIGSASGRYVLTSFSGSGLDFINSNSVETNSDGDLTPAQPYTGAGSLYFNGTALVSSKPITVATDTDWKDFTPSGTFAKGTGASCTMRLKKEGTKGIVHMRGGTLSSALKANIWVNFILVPSDMIPAYETVAVGGSMLGVPVLFYVNSTGMIKLSLMSDMAAAINVMNCYFEYPLS